MTILYPVGSKLYLNITNQCPCACIFCIRNNGDTVYGSDSLWLENEPTEEQIFAEFDKFDLSKYTEFVFCGYGEPLERLNTVINVGKHLKALTGKPVRVNTNGLSDLIHGKPTAHLLIDAVDIVSISLNAGTAAEYCRITQASFGYKSFDAMLKFAADCKKFLPKVIFTLVDVISKDEIVKCREISGEMGIELRIRKYEG